MVIDVKMSAMAAAAIYENFRLELVVENFGEQGVVGLVRVVNTFVILLVVA